MKTKPTTVDLERLERVLNVELPVIVVLAEKQMTLEEVLALDRDAVISFQKLSVEPLEFHVNDRLLGTGKAIKVEDKFGIYMETVDSPEEALKKLEGDL